MLPPLRVLTTTRGLMGVVLGAACLCSGILLLGCLAWSMSSHCGPAGQTNIRLIGLGLIQYQNQYGCFPPAYVADEQGKPLYSWRVLILPYLDSNDLYNAFNFRQPWNGPDNLAISNQSLWFFRSPHDHDTDGMPYATNFLAVTGPGTLFPDGGKTTRLADVRDGPNTILLVEVADSSIHWAEPRDLDVRTMSIQINDAKRPSISSRLRLDPSLVLLDGSIRKLGASVKPATVSALITIRGGEKLDLDRPEMESSTR